MKKTLAALAVLGAFAGSVAAAEVTVYGLIDLGLAYNRIDNGANTTDNFTMESGQNSASRFGLKGEEDLGNGVKVGFVLENQFSADDGQLGNNSRLFGREASLYVTGDMGTLKFGRLTQMTNSTGTTGLMGGTVSAFSTGWGGVRGHKSVMAGSYSQFDNMIMYSTPEFAGLQVHVQYSFDKDVTDDALVTGSHGSEGHSTVDRYAAIGMTYKAGDLNLVGAIEQYNYASYNTSGRPNDDGLTVNFGGAYDFGLAKVYGVAQYFKHMNLWQKGFALEGTGGAYTSNSSKGGQWYDMEGYGVFLSTGIPAFGGTAKFGVGYMDAEQCGDSDYDIERWQISAAYEYNLTKRTQLYIGAGYAQDSYGMKNQDDASYLSVIGGMIHKF